MTSAPSPFRYVHALDGVRALSVIAILLFHSPFLWARGGFLGVSVFFTLSGFLITSLLLSERERTGRIDLKAFWVRRARRLAPAVLVLLALVASLLAVGGLARREGTLGDAVATAGWGANWRFVLNGESYNDMFSQPSPFQHMWSLAVEEQFYLLFPGLLLLLLGRSQRLHRWRAGLFVVGGIAVSTFALHALFVPGDSERAYYGTDTRMAEPFMGVLLALLITRGGSVRTAPRAVRRLLDVAAVGALAGLAYLAHSLGQYSHFLYDGGLLLVALLTAVLLAGVTQPGSFLGKVLSLAPLSWLGRISYGVYVFHWPVFLWLTPQRTGLSQWPLLGYRCALVLALAATSYLLLEQPIRQARRFRVGFAVPAWANATVLALAVLVLATGTISAPTTPRDDDRVSASGVAPAPKKARKPQQITTAAKPAVTKAHPRPAVSSGARPATSTVQAPRAPRPSGAPAGPPSPAARPTLRIAVVGDSLADNLGIGMVSWAGDRTDVVAKNFAISGCPIALGGMRRWPDGYEARVKGTCSWYVDHDSERWKQFAAFDPQVVVIQDGMNELVERKLDEWDDYHKAGEAVFDEWMTAEYSEALDILNPLGTRKLLLLNAVCADWERVNHFQGNGVQLELEWRVNALNRNYASLSAPNLMHVNFKAHLCPNGRYTDTVDGVESGRYDGYHLTDEASIALATRWLGPLCIDATKD